MRFIDLMFASRNGEKQVEESSIRSSLLHLTAELCWTCANFNPTVKGVVTHTFEIRRIVTPDDEWLGSYCYKSSETCRKASLELVTESKAELFSANNELSSYDMKNPDQLLDFSSELKSKDLGEELKPGDFSAKLKS
ncbi:hypothetical protein TNCT_231731 [Trichonephila clavata]|uniref:Uncharacterized protein n=1 Tax=Trichonephila clavata TaxID=2740835 RepID=A0A8X6GEU8_TRICU|nr:hypothetical protein TNCT_231731 [Trichonephila clavata]